MAPRASSPLPEAQLSAVDLSLAPSPAALELLSGSAAAEQRPQGTLLADVESSQPSVESHVLVLGDCALSMALLMLRAWAADGDAPSSGSGFRDLLSSRSIVHCHPSVLEMQSDLVKHPAVIARQREGLLHLGTEGSIVDLVQQYPPSSRILHVLVSVLCEADMELAVFRQVLRPLSSTFDDAGALFLLLSVEQGAECVEGLERMAAEVGLALIEQEQTSLPEESSDQGSNPEFDYRSFARGVVLRFVKDPADGENDADISD